MFQFWFNTFFVSQAAVTKEIFEDEPTLKTLELDSNLRSFSIGRDHLDKAHKDSKEKIFPADFMVWVEYYLTLQYVKNLLNLPFIILHSGLPFWWFFSFNLNK